MEGQNNKNHEVLLNFRQAISTTSDNLGKLNYGDAASGALNIHPVHYNSRQTLGKALQNL